MVKKEASDSVERRKKEAVASLKLGKTNRNHLSISKDSTDLSSVSEDSDEVCSGELAKKNLSTEFASVSKASLDLSPKSEVSDGAHSAMSPVEDLSSAASLDAFSSLELTPTSQITKIKYDISEDTSAEDTLPVDSIYSRNRSAEADVVTEHLKRAWIQIQRCDDIDNQSKKLFRTLIRSVTEELHGMPEDSDLLSKIIQEKTRIVVTCLVLWMMCTAVAVYVKCHADIPFGGPPPT